jgi:hypothetical protein
VVEASQTPKQHAPTHAVVPLEFAGKLTWAAFTTWLAAMWVPAV